MGEQDDQSEIRSRDSVVVNDIYITQLCRKTEGALRSSFQICMDPYKETLKI